MSTDEEKVHGLPGLRKKLGLTQEDIAKALGVSTRSVINWENGHHEPRLTIRQMKALCALLKLPIEQVPEDLSFNPENQNAERGSNTLSE
ncbi:helix-turn-helix transcriptional regulator [Oculatella sp. LEGE 06141]|nr:helix-turn-helix transcriptional regulator [Oculatella sp. LEGE 06141]MBE9182887.1 helix-turn-helix transcriptional regulator [Oculatella sp. LEGE 06141]